MSSPMKQGLIKCQGLDTTKLSEIKHLAQLCNQYEELDLKLNWNILRHRPTDQYNDFLYYADGELVGFLALFSFSSQEGEISGMVHPAHRQSGIFNILFKAAYQESYSRGLLRLLLIVEQASSAGQAFARHLPTIYDHSEYKMILEKLHRPDTSNQRLHFRTANIQDATIMSDITAQAFQMSQGEVDWYNESTISQLNHRYYVGEVDGVIVGKIDVSLSEDSALILGFAVSPEYQGHGHGRQILMHTVQELIDSGQQSIWLEVSAENRHALSLYQSCGFKETGSYDYYRLQLNS